MKYFVLLLTAGALLMSTQQIQAQQQASSFVVDGITVIMKPTVKDIINVSVYYKGGVTNYGAEKAGIGNLALAGTTECGTRSYTKDEFKDKADTYGIQVSGFSTYDYGRISLNCISKYFNEGWSLLTDAVKNPVYQEKDFDLLKQKVISDIKNEASDPDSKIQKMAIENTFKGTSYAIDPLGELSTVNTLSAKEVKDYYYHTLLNKNRMFIVVVGKLSKSEISQKIQAAFGSLPEKPYTPPSYQTPVITKNSLNIVPRELSTNYVAGVTNAPGYTSADFVANQLAIAAFSDKMFEEIRTNRNLSYAPYAYSLRREMPYTFIYVSTPKPEAAVSVINDEIERLKKEGFTQEQFDEMRNLFITSNYMKEESTDAIAYTLGTAKVLGNWEMPEQYVDKIRQTTPEDLSRVFRKYVRGIDWNYLGDENAADSAKAVFNKSSD